MIVAKSISIFQRTTVALANVTFYNIWSRQLKAAPAKAKAKVSPRAKAKSKSPIPVPQVMADVAVRSQTITDGQRSYAQAVAIGPCPAGPAPVLVPVLVAPTQQMMELPLPMVLVGALNDASPEDQTQQQAEEEVVAQEEQHYEAIAQEEQHIEVAQEERQVEVAQEEQRAEVTVEAQSVDMPITEEPEIAMFTAQAAEEAKRYFEIWMRHALGRVDGPYRPAPESLMPLVGIHGKPRRVAQPEANRRMARLPRMTAQFQRRRIEEVGGAIIPTLAEDVEMTVAANVEENQGVDEAQSVVQSQA